MELSLFTELAILVALAVGISFIMRLIRQPLLIGYIVTGLLVGPFAFDLLHSGESFELFAEIGIALLLFIVGLNLTPSVIRKFGKTALFVGLGQVVFMFLVGYGVATLLGFATITALYIAAALTFSSTVIVMKLLGDLGDVDSLYGRIAIGVLLIQDIIAIALLFIIPLFASDVSGPTNSIILTLVRGAAVVIAVFGIAYYLLPKIHRFISRSQEMLFLFSVGWGMGFAAVFRSIGFSLEAGALLAGVSLSILPSQKEISSRLSPLRDFFLLLFFILLGSEMVLADFSAILMPALALSAVVLIGSPPIIMIFTGLLGYTKKTSFKTANVLSQISEFSFVLVALGVRVGHLEPQILSMVTLVGLITIFGSTYLSMNSGLLYSAFFPILWLFERKHTLEPKAEKRKYDYILLGADRIGTAFVDALRGKDLLVVDYNPEVIDRLREEGIDVQYGDVGDPELLQKLPMEDAKVVISTIPEFSVTEMLLPHIENTKLFITTSKNIDDAISLYSHEQVDYVITPHFLGGEYAASLVAQWDKDTAEIPRLREEHLESLEKRLKIGHMHP